MLSETTRAVRRLPQVLDRYLLPKVAFVMVTTASAAGAVLTGFRHGWTDWPTLLARWAALWLLGLFLGAEMWKLFYMRPSVRLRPVAPALDYAAAMTRLYTTWQKALVPLLVAAVGAYIYLYAGSRPGAGPWLIVAAAAMALALVGMTLTWVSPTDPIRRDVPSWLVLTGLAAVVAAIGGLDVAVQPAGQHIGWLVPNRMLHLWAFSAWLGGAFWNIFIAVPAGIQRVDMDTVILANFQLERFRVVVRTVLATIIATGLVQTWAIFGWRWQSLFTNVWGYLILAKLGLILALVVVFITCPMWRACSPIRGVCNLDDLDD